MIHQNVSNFKHKNVFLSYILRLFSSLNCGCFQFGIDDGFRLTYLGYDFLAIKALLNRGVFSAVGRQIGVGKESGIHLHFLYPLKT